MNIDFEALRQALAPVGLDLLEFVSDAPDNNGHVTVSLYARVQGVVKRHPIVGTVKTKPEFASGGVVKNPFAIGRELKPEEIRPVDRDKTEKLARAYGAMPQFIMRSQEDIVSRVFEALELKEGVVETIMGREPAEKIEPTFEELTTTAGETAECKCEAPWNTGHEPGCKWKESQS